MAEVAAVFFGQFCLFSFGQFVPPFAGRQRMQDLIQAPSFAESTRQLAVGHLEAERRVLSFRGRVATVLTEPPEVYQRNVAEHSGNVSCMLEVGLLLNYFLRFRAD